MSQLQVYKASAGSGKTFRLALHFIESLLRPGSTEDQYAHILGVTFTNKATAEMKDRILATLYGIAHGSEDSEPYYQQIVADFAQEKRTLSEQEIREGCRKALMHILHDYQRFRVQTIDSFFQTILKGMAHELGLNANFQVDLNNEQVLEAAVDQVIDSVNDDKEIYTLLYKIVEENIEDNKGWNVVNNLKSFSKVIFNEDYLKRSEQLHDSLRDPKVMKAFRVELRKQKDTLKRLCNDLQTALQMLWDSHPAFHEKIKYAGDYVSFIHKLTWSGLGKAEIGKRMEDCLNDPSSVIKSGVSQSPDLIAFTEALSAQLRTIQEKLPAMQNTLNNITLTSKNLSMLSLLRHIDEAVSAINEDASRFTLSKTQILLNSMIKDEDASFVFEKIGALLEEVMIDEFQDTSMLQWQNFCSLLLETQAKGGRNFIVGDVKQSIYHWRGGDWRILGNINPTDCPGVDMHTLDTNRRSMRNIVNFNNSFFDRVVSYADQYAQEFRDKLDVPFSFEKAYENQAQYPFKKDAEGYVRVGVVTQEKGRDVKEVILADLKTQVRNLLKDGVKATDITILVRKNDDVKPIIASFAENNDLPQIVSDDAFLLESSDVVMMLIEMLRLTVNPKDMVAAYYLQKRHINVDEVLEKAKAAESLSLYDLIETFYRSIDIKKYPGQDAYVFYFLDAVMNFMHSNATDIQAFLNYWDEKLHKKPISSAQVNGIRITTVHKSKGLEFHTVLMPFTNWEFFSSNNPNLVWCGKHEAPYDAIPFLPITMDTCCVNSIFDREYAENFLMVMLEEINILYVAFTRAEMNLFVWTTEQKETPSKASVRASTLIHAIMNEHFVVAQKDKPELALPMEITTEGDEMTVFTLGKRVGALAEKSKKSSRMEPISLPCDVEKSSAAPTLVFQQSNQSKKFCRQFDDPSQVDLKRETYMEQGSLLHRVLQDIKTDADIPQVLDTMEGEGLIAINPSESRTKISRATIEHLLQKGLKSAQVKSWFSGVWKVMNECAIIARNFEGVAQTKRPDRVMISPDASHIIVVDYKFGVMKTEYKEQVADYMQLLQQMYPHAKIEGYLWFVYTNHVEAVK